MLKIKLADGTLIENLGMNGNNYVSQAPIEDGVFEDNLSTVTVTENGIETVYENMKLIQNKQYGEEYWFIIVEKTPEEIEREGMYQLLADLTEMVILGGAK